MKRIFIAGLGRSGTTITLSALYHHHQVLAFPVETKFLVEEDGFSALISAMTSDFSVAGAGLVTLCDAAPASLSWLGGVLGQRVAPLGVERFGQTGNLADLYAAYRLDGAAITEAVAEILLPA